MRNEASGALRRISKYSLICAVLIFSACRDEGDLLTIYGGELRDIETSAGLEDIRVELWRIGRNEDLIQSKLTDRDGRFEFAFFSVGATTHNIRINASENQETNCKITVMLEEGRQLHEIKHCKRSDYLLSVSLSEESKLLPIHRISIQLRNEDCNVNFESFSTEDIIDFNKFFEVFPESRYRISFSFQDSLNQIIQSNDLEVEIEKEVVELKL